MQNTKKDRPSTPEHSPSAVPPGRPARRRISLEAFGEEGRALFGERGRDWQFRCPGCGGVQTPLDFVNLGVAADHAMDRATFSCIGRLPGATRGCDWTLGGLFQLHLLEVISGDVTQRCFEFATPENAPGPGFTGLGKRVGAAPEQSRPPRRSRKSRKGTS